VGLFKSKEEKEMEREIAFRKGVTRIQGFVKKNEQVKKRYWEAGKKALRLGDQKRFQQYARGYQYSLNLIKRWETYLLDLQMLSVRRDQVKATTNFIESMKALSQSLLSGAKPKDIVKMEVAMEKAVAQGQALDEALSVAMEVGGESLFAFDEVSDESIKDIEQSMVGEAGRDEGESFDAEIEAGLKRIEQEMRKELK